MAECIVMLCDWLPCEFKRGECKSKDWCVKLGFENLGMLDWLQDKLVGSEIESA